MEKIIFLDIDGVLNVIPQGFDDYGAKFHKHFEDNLKWIIEQTEAKIVVSSTWRFRGLKIMKEMWSKRGLAGNVIDVTPDIDICERGKEIQKWLDSNEVDSYVIIDDDTDMLESQMDNFVRTSENKEHKDCIDIGYGLTKIFSEKAVSILNNCN